MRTGGELGAVVEVVDDLEVVVVQGEEGQDLGQDGQDQGQDIQGRSQEGGQGLGAGNLGQGQENAPGGQDLGLDLDATEAAPEADLVTGNLAGSLARGQGQNQRRDVVQVWRMAQNKIPRLLLQ